MQNKAEAQPADASNACDGHIGFNGKNGCNTHDIVILAVMAIRATGSFIMNATKVFLNNFC